MQGKAWQPQFQAVGCTERGDERWPLSRVRGRAVGGVSLIRLSEKAVKVTRRLG